MKKERVRRLLRMNFDLVALGLVDEFIYVREKSTDKITIQRSIEKESEMKRSEFFELNQVNRIDLFVRDHKPQRIIELDGLYHGFGDDITMSEQTKSRNENYALGGFTENLHTLIVLTENDLAKSDKELVETLEIKLGMKRKINSEDLSQRSRFAKPCTNPDCNHFSRDHVTVNRRTGKRRCDMDNCPCEDYQHEA